MDSGIGIPIDLYINANSSIKYDAYIITLAEAGVSASFGYGIRWEKVWFIIYKPVFYSESKADAYASVDAIYYVDTSGNSFDIINSLETGVTISPYAKVGISLNAAAVLHGGFEIESGITGNVGFKYEMDKSTIVGKYSMNYDNKINANVFLGFKKVKILGIFDIGDIGFGKKWDLLKNSKFKSGVIIPETKFFEMEL